MATATGPSSKTRALTLALWVASMVLTACGIGLLIATVGTKDRPPAFAYRELYPLLPLVFSSVGAVITWRVPRNAIGWLFGAVGLLVA
jgi:hypothetical protein